MLSNKYVIPFSLILLVGGSLLPFLSGSTAWIYPFTKSLYSRICHGIPDRCYEISGVPLHLCARCIGIYSGLFAGSITAIFQGKKYLPLSKRRYLLLSFSPVILHKSLELAGMVHYNLPAATVTGLLSGFLLFLYISNRFLLNFQNGVNDPK